ncbi:MAG: redoxin domain-containing protein [Candidatus Scalindua sp.]|nr:redoxin domain-containing protein [Candidatus Scalindua sp.]
MKRNKTTMLKAACAFVLGLLFFTYTNIALGVQTNRTIKGNITNIPPDASNIIHLYSYYGNQLSEDASAPVNEQGDFKFGIKDTLQQGLYKIGIDKKSAASIVLSGEKDIVIKADYGQLKADRITVTNSRENVAYRALLNEWNRMGRMMYSLNIEKSRISTVDPFFTRKTKDIEEKVRLVMDEHNVNLFSMKETYPDTFMSEVLVSLSLIPLLQTYHPDLEDDYDNERAFMHDYFFEYIDFSDERIIYTPFLEKKYFMYLDKYTHHTPEGIKDSVDLILTKAEANSAVREFTIEYLIDTFNKKGLSESADYVVDNYVEGCSKPLSKRTVEKIENIKRLRVGQTAPEIVSNDSDGKTIAMSTLIGNNVLMVYFWASWCEGCEAENPNIVRIYNKYKERGFDIYAVSLDKDKAEWLKAIKRHEFPWTNVSDLSEWESEAVKAYNVNRTPGIYLLDKDGRIMAKNLRGKELEMKIEGLLNLN